VPQSREQQHNDVEQNNAFSVTVVFAAAVECFPEKMPLDQSASVIEDLAPAVQEVAYGELSSNVKLAHNGWSLRATRPDEHGITYLKKTIDYRGVVRWASFRILSLKEPDSMSNASPSVSVGLAPQSTVRSAVHSIAGSVALDSSGTVWRDGKRFTNIAALVLGDSVAFGYNNAQHTVTISVNGRFVADVQQEYALQPDLYPAVSLLLVGTEVSFEWSYTNPARTEQNEEQPAVESYAVKAALQQLDAATASSMALQQQQSLQARTKKAQLIRASAQLLAARQQHQDEAEVLRLRLAKRQWHHRIHETLSAEQVAARTQQRTELTAAAMTVYREKWLKGCDRAAADAAATETAVREHQQQAAAESAVRVQATATKYEQQGIAQGEQCKDVYAAAEAGVPLIYLQVCKLMQCNSHICYNTCCHSTASV
jgi:hypothetical protein